METKLYIIMGVSGCGKTTIGKALSTALGLPFYDADDFHPEENIRKMSAGIPLQDADRKPWLKNLNTALLAWQNQKGAVLACSALKEKYRAILQKNLKNIQWVYLYGTFETIRDRMLARETHFMGTSLLASQFETLEPPNYGLHIDINEPPKQIVQLILEKRNMKKSDIGLIGLGVMGKSLSLNIADNGFAISVYNRIAEGEETVVSDFVEENKGYSNIQGFTDLKAFVASLSTPRKVFLMVKAGAAVDAVVEQLLPYLEKEDVIIDGGNSHYADTQLRADTLLEKGIHFVGSGVSGGEEGARRGPSIMPGGTKHSYAQVGTILEAISAKDTDGNPCCTHVGTGGAGHFVKMIHNGIEYAEMQLLAELITILSVQYKYPAISAIFSEWGKGALGSYLLEITSQILQVKEGEHYLLDLILDKAGNKGTGSWSSKAALDLGYPNTMMSAAVFARYMSAFKEKRAVLSKNISTKNGSSTFDIEQIEKAYRAAQVINHHQGFALIQAASDTYNWGLNLPEIARIWTNGCIIRSTFMKACIGTLSDHKELLDSPSLFEEVQSAEQSLSDVLKKSMDWRIAMPCLSNAYQYWISMTTERLSANVIQAQRDFFGAHTYQRIDKDRGTFFHTKWV